MASPRQLHPKNTTASTSAGCQYTNNTNSCDADGDLCTAGDKCSNGSCLPGAKKTCADSNPCTADTCDPKTAQCSFAGLPDGATCSDSNACTENDACAKGICGGIGKNCNDGNACTSRAGAAAAGRTGRRRRDGNRCARRGFGGRRGTGNFRCPWPKPDADGRGCGQGLENEAALG
ncbi:MAG: hypothetical protein FJ100_15360 [Deltaproteobacteria bacterium]|nr:hypothetical protein [Deltaproteobacteria bacterium]